MKNFFSFFFSLSLLLAGFGTRAQGVMTFEGENHDFANVLEGTMATHEFVFRNTGNQPIIIANVQASCGCTTPDWTKTPVLPGKSGMVKASYSSAGRPGAFNKTVTVTSNAATPSTVLSIKGTVLNKDEMKTQLTPAQLARSPRAVVSATSHDFGKLELGQHPSVRLTVKNTGPEELVLGPLTAPCGCVGYKTAPQPVKPGQSSMLELVYTPQRAGQQQEAVTIGTNDLNGDVKLALRANVVKDLNGGSMVREGAAAVPFK